VSLDLRKLLRFSKLKNLYLRGYKKNIESLTGLPDLKSLFLRGITPDSLAWVKDLGQLEVLSVQLGGFTRFSDLYGATNIRALNLFMIKKLDNLDVVAQLPNLRMVMLCSLRNVTHFPDLSHHQHLRLIEMENMKSLTDFSALEFVPNLLAVNEIVSPTLTAEMLLPILRNPSVKACGFAAGNKATRELISQFHKSYDDCDEATLAEIRELNQMVFKEYC
jgi:hypothetical protein